MELKLRGLDDPKMVTEALRLADSHLRDSSPPLKVIVECCDIESDMETTRRVRRQIENHGWTIRMIERVKETETDDDEDDEELAPDWWDGIPDYSYGHYDDGNGDDDDDDDDDNFINFYQESWIDSQFDDDGEH